MLLVFWGYAGRSLPYTIGLTGDLGQTNDSHTNIVHFTEDADIDSVLHVGDLSYADSLMVRWDTWGTVPSFIFSS